jgi:heme-degrading monooxygenase HmoA
LPSARSALSYWLVDREGRKGLIATFWNNEEAMHASEQSRLKRQEGHSVRSRLEPIVLNKI